MSFILDEQIGAVLRLTLNRPEKKNALTQDMYQRLADKINEAAGDFSIRAVVINSNGDSFTAGNDINDFVYWILRCLKVLVCVVRLLGN